MTVEQFDKQGWHKGIKVRCYGRQKEYFLEVLNVDLIKRKVYASNKKWYFREFFDLI
jgi:hypothetical protein